MIILLARGTLTVLSARGNHRWVWKGDTNLVVRSAVQGCTLLKIKLPQLTSVNVKKSWWGLAKCCKSISSIVLNCPNVGRGWLKLKRGLLMSFCKWCKRSCPLLFSSQVLFVRGGGGKMMMMMHLEMEKKEHSDRGKCSKGKTRAFYIAFCRNFYFLVTSSSPQPFQTINY